MVNDINSLTQSSISTTGKKPESATTVNANSAEHQQQAVATGSAAKESIEISSQAQLLSTLEAQIKDLPDIDESRLDSLREQINQGTYQIDDSSLAQRIIDLEF